jgi:hypothetical protein
MRPARLVLDYAGPLLQGLATAAAAYDALQRITAVPAVESTGPFIPACTLAASYAALASHSWAASHSSQQSPGMKRLEPRELGVLLATLLTLWFYYVPVHILLPLSDACVGRCRRFLQGSSFSRGPVDLSDDQWRSFRESARFMLALAVGHVLLSRSARRLSPGARHTALAAFSVVFLLVAHGVRALIPLALAGANFAASQRYAGRAILAPAAAWLFGLALLLLREFGRDLLSFRRLAGARAAPLDTHMIGWCASPAWAGGHERHHTVPRARALSGARCGVKAVRC